MIYQKFLIFLVHLTACLCIQSKSCGYDSCNLGMPDMLNVHIVSHTHDDVGWVLTLDQYYIAYVKDIIHSVIYHLNEDANRRFVYVESAFFHKWWDEQQQDMRDRVTKLVNSGRLEFVGGGWVMNDEAVTHYEAIIDQMTTGLRFLNETFGSCAVPKTVWQIDPFGHSREQASLFAQMRFDGLFLGRIDYQDIKNRKQKKTMEFMWKGSDSLGKASNIFTGILPNVYWPPKGFCFDVGCWDEEITDQNANVKARTFMEVIKDQAKQYKTNHTIITMGMDFHYRHAGKWFRNIEKLMSAINSFQATGSKINVFYSTPACYLKALNMDDNQIWKTETADFLPYASEANSYWTGFYTSRPTLKLYSRQSMAILQTCRQLTTFASMPTAHITPLKRAVAVLQHHDAITGTEKQHVAKDYAKMLGYGLSLCQEEIKTAISRLMPNLTDKNDLQFCNFLNNTECRTSENEALFRVIVYNSLSRNLSTYIRIPVRGQGYVVHDAFGQKLHAQILPIPGFLALLPDRTGSSRYELVFPAQLPPVGATSFKVKRHQDFAAMEDPDSWTDQNRLNSQSFYSIKNDYFEVRVNRVSGLLESVVVGQEVIPLKQNYFYYTSQPGFLNEKASGAYAFNPMYDLPTRISANVTVTVLKGDLVEEIWQKFSSWVSQVIRVYKDKPYIEFDWVVGPIPVRDYHGKEIITKFESGLNNNGVFYTDSNSRETMKRVRNQRPTWNLTVLEVVAGNYYPTTGWVYIKDEEKKLQLTLMTDRAQGAGSIEDGSLEIMVHRRTLYDDGYGVDEALNEIGSNGQGLVVRGKHLLLISSFDESTKLIRELAKELFHRPNYIFLPLNASSDEDRNDTNKELHFSSLTAPLPPNIHILTLELLNNVEVLLRLEHTYESMEHPNFSVPVTISLKNLFCAFTIVAVRETTLSANQYLEDVTELLWRVEKEPQSRLKRNNIDTHNSSIQVDLFLNNNETQTVIFPNEPTPSAFESNLEVRLKPMQIKTFIATINRTLCENPNC